MAAKTIPIRKMGLPFEDLPRHWFFRHPRHTAALNALSLLFPSGERFFIRSVKHFEEHISDPDLKAAMRGFYGQEANHQKEHLAANVSLEAQGIEIASFIAWYERVAWEVVEPRFSPAVRLAATAALEHLTATLAEVALTGSIAHAHPAMRDLLMWHASEEIEHKSVAYDVLQAVDPRYRTRLAGFAVALSMLGYIWLRGTRHLLAQEPRPFPRSPPEARERLRQVIPFVARRLVEYLRPGFHPEQHDNRHLARAYLASINRLAG